MGIGGFNEYIMIYGWDDDEIYVCFIEDGLNWMDVVFGMIYYLFYDDVLCIDKVLLFDDVLVVEILLI